MPLEFVPSERGKPKLLYEGHMFYRDRAIAGVTQWKCVYHRKFRCTHRVYTKDDEVVYRWKDHNHVADISTVKAAKLQKRLREVSENTNDSPKNTLIQCLETASQATIARLPRMTHMKRTINNRRKNVRK